MTTLEPGQKRKKRKKKKNMAERDYGLGSKREGVRLVGLRRD